MRRLWATIDSVLPPPERSTFGVASAVATALAAVASAIFLRVTLNVSLPFLPVIVAVMIAAARGGLIPAIVVEGIGLPAVLWLVPIAGITDNVKGVGVLAAVLLTLGVAGELVSRARSAARVDLCRLQQREKYLQSIFDTLPISLVVVDEDGRVLAANEIAKGMFGEHAADLDQHHIKEFLRAPESDRAIDLVSGMENATEELLTIVRPHRDDVELAVASADMTVGDHRFRSFYFRDVTERRRVELRLAELQAEVEQLGRASALGQLGTAIAHELNQPLATAALYGHALRALLTDGQTVEAMATVDLLHKQIFRAQAVLGRLREFVRSSQAKIAWNAASAVLAETTELAQMAVRQVAADLIVDVDPRVGDLLVDRVALQQVLLNLILNAADAVRGRPQRLLKLSVVSDGIDTARVTLIDTGPGVSSTVRDRIFDPFVTDKPDGLGVGLAITRSIVEAHGGRIWYDQHDSGACFHFTLRHRENGVLTDVA